MGSSGLLGILFWAYKFGFDIDVLSRTWNWDYMKEVDEKETEYLGMDEYPFGHFFRLVGPKNHNCFQLQNLDCSNMSYQFLLFFLPLH